MDLNEIVLVNFNEVENSRDFLTVVSSSLGSDALAIHVYLIKPNCFPKFGKEWHLRRKYFP